MQCLFLLNITLKNNGLYLLTRLALHIDRLHEQTARDTGGEWGRGEAGQGEEHTVTFFKRMIKQVLEIKHL